MNPKKITRDEQQIYGSFLHYAVSIVLVLLYGVFILYIFEILPLNHSMEEIMMHWDQSAAIFNQELDTNQGWSLLQELPKSDSLSLLTLLLFAFIPVCAVAALIPRFVRKSDWVYVTITLVQISIFILAISGLIS